MNTNIKFSIIINCFNGEKYLNEAIDSVVAQTYNNWELIFWDNQSIDKTAEIVKSYNDDRIRYFYAPEHTSLGEARNLALKKTCGNFIGFLDADDIWVDSFLATYIYYINSHKDVGLFYSKFINYDGTNRWQSIKNDKSYRVTKREFIEDYKVGMSSVVFSREVVFNNNIFFNPEFSLIEDFDFFLRLRTCTDVVYIPDSLMIYRIHSGNLSKSLLWPSEFDILISKIKNKDGCYSKLAECTRYIEGRKNYYIIRNLIQEGKRCQALVVSVRSIFVSIKYVRFVMLVLVGESFALKLRKFLFRNNYEI